MRRRQQIARLLVVVVAMAAAIAQDTDEPPRGPEFGDLPPEVQRRLAAEALIAAEEDFKLYGRRTPLETFLPGLVLDRGEVVVKARAPEALIADFGRAVVLTTDLPAMFAASLYGRGSGPAPPFVAVAFNGAVASRSTTTTYGRLLPAVRRLEIRQGFSADGWAIVIPGDQPRPLVSLEDLPPAESSNPTVLRSQAVRVHPVIALVASNRVDVPANGPLALQIRATEPPVAVSDVGHHVSRAYSPVVETALVAPELPGEILAPLNQ